MSSKGLLMALVALAVVGVGVFLVAGGGGLLDDDSSTDSTGDGDTDFVDVDGTGVEGDGTNGAADSPVLFGRASARIGKGDAIGRVAEFQTKKPAEGVTLRVTGVGYADEDVATTATSETDGRFHLAGVPAGEDYVLDVVADGRVVRTVRGVAITADKVEDLGAIWLGDAGTLEGRVLSIDGTPLAGADVAVLPGGTSMDEMMQDIVGFITKLDRDPEPIAIGKTNASGRFRIEGIPPGPITVVARMGGYRQGVKRVVMSADGAVGNPPEFLLEPAQPITGRVVDDNGVGIGGARIAFMDQDDDQDGFFTRRFVQTANDGSFSVESPPAAGKLIAIVAAEHFPTLFSEVEDQRQGLEFILVAGARLMIRFVHDDTGEPIPDASIVAMVMEGRDMSNNRGTFLTGVTDPDGRVEFVSRPGFVMMLFFEHATEGMSMYSPQFGGAGGFALKGPGRIDLVNGDNEVELRKPTGVLMTGTVTNVDGKPVPGASVAFSGGFFMGGGSKAVTDENGVYRMMGPKMPQIAVTVKAPGYVQDPKTMAAEVGDARAVEHDVTLLYAATVEGKVVGPNGEPAGGLEVRLKAEKKDESGNMYVEDMTGGGSTTTTDRAGRFVLEDIAPGLTYRLVARGPGYVISRSEPFDVGGNVRHAKAPRLTMTKGSSVSVRVIEPSGRDVSGAMVDVHVEPKESVHWDFRSQWRSFDRLVTKASGEATVDDIPDGTVTFTARKDGFAAARATATVAFDGPELAAVEVRLRVAVEVSGIVRDQHGDAVKDAKVRVNANSQPNSAPGDANDQWVPSANGTTDTYGRFKIAGIPANTSISLWIDREGYRGQGFPIVGRTDGLDLTIHKVDPADAKRLEYLQAQLMEVYSKLQNAKDDTERQEFSKQIQAINMEMQELQSGSQLDRVVEAVPDGG